MTIIKLFMVGVAAVAGAGCSTRVAVVSHEKSAYVVRTESFSSAMYHCKADSGKPVCTRVQELE